MALVKCPECGQEISDQATSCPNCGHQIGQKSKKHKQSLIVGGIVAFAAVIGIVVFINSDGEKYKRAISDFNSGNYEKAVQKLTSLNDYKDSAEWLKKANHMVEVKNDVVKPEIELTQNELSCWVGDDFNVDEELEGVDIIVTDDVSGILPYGIDTKNIDTSTSGDKKIVISAVDEAGNVAEADILVHVKEKPSDAYYAYYEAINISFDDLTKDSITDTYYYNGISVLPEDVNWYISWGKKVGASSLNQDILYNALAMKIDGFYVIGKFAYGNWKSIVPDIFEFEALDSWNEMRPYVENARTFITRIDPLNSVMKKFSTMKSVTGEFDFINSCYNFEISNLDDAAKEMGISSTMLGYILAFIDVYGPDTTIESNSYTCNLEVKAKVQEINRDDFYIRAYNGVEIDGDGLDLSDSDNNLLSYMDKVDSNNYYFLYSPELDESKEAVVTTARNIKVGDSQAEVQAVYGKQDIQTVNLADDPLYNVCQNENDTTMIQAMKENCKSYCVYNYEDEGQIIFYFDSDDSVSLILYLAGIFY